MKLTTLKILCLILASSGCLTAQSQGIAVGRYSTLELSFNASVEPANPFDVFVLKLRVTDPMGVSFILDGFYDGDGEGGQSGFVWKARICPTIVGTWRWETVPGEAEDPSLYGLRGDFECLESPDRGGLVADGHFFRLQSGDPLYLAGNFLDFRSGRVSTHVFMSEWVDDPVRTELLEVQKDFHGANKINVYFANKGDYGGVPVTPWVGDKNSNDKTRMDLSRWRLYDRYIRDFKDSGLLAEMWFFADDSSFGSLSQTDQERLIRYAMARTSAFNHVLYVLALEWQEGFSMSRINALGSFIQSHNPWKRVVSVHNLSLVPWPFAGETWPTFIATQAGNNAPPNTVNSYAREMRTQFSIPHVDEEFGILNSETDTRLRNNLWANLCGGAAGGGTGSDLKPFQRFLSQSRVPFQRMAPSNDLVEDGGNTRFCLAESDHHYLVYSRSGPINLTVAGSGLTGRWFNPRDPNSLPGAPFSVTAGSQTYTPPNDPGSDWVLFASDGSNLSAGITHPSTGSEMLQVDVSTRRDLEVSPSGHYIQYQGEKLLMVGESGTQVVTQNANIDYREWIDDCAERGIRAVHVWSFMGPRQKQDGSVLEDRFGYVYPGITPWKRSLAGSLATDQLPRWNLQEFDDGPDGDPTHYWSRLRDLCSYAKSREIIVGYTVFTGWIKGNHDAWPYHPFNAANGGHLTTYPQAGVTIDTPGTEIWEEDWSEGWTNPKKTQWFWERFAKKAIDDLGAIGNVFFVFFDEHSYTEGNMGDHFRDFFQSRGQVWVDWEPRRSSVDWVMSETFSGEDKNANAVAGFNASPNKPYLFLEGEPYQGEGVRTAIWTFTQGGGHFFFHADAGQETARTGIMGYDPNVPGGNKGVEKRDWLGHASRFFNQHIGNLDTLVPHNELTGPNEDCLADTGREYIVYSKSGSDSFEVDLSGATGTLRSRFYDPRSGTFQPPFDCDGGGVRHFAKPDSKDWVLQIQDVPTGSASGSTAWQFW